MTTFGYTLSSEEHAPATLVANARRAEAAGFDFLSISDHYHPWVSAQGHSPFVWSVLGAIAASTERVRVGVGVSCPIVRMHPAVVAQAAATTSLLFGDRFFLGVGTGEALNEHIVGQRWPPPAVRLEMLEEAIAIIRALFTGDTLEHRGAHYEVDNARLFDAPDGRVPVWPNTAVPGQVSQDLPTWTHFEQATEIVTDDEATKSVPCGPDIAEELRDSVSKYVDAGYDHLYFHQIGDDQQGFLRYWEHELRDALS